MKKNLISVFLIGLFCSFILWAQDDAAALGDEYFNAGVEYYNATDYNNALACFAQAAKVYKEVYGENNSDLADSYNNIGKVLHLSGKYDAALEYHKASLKIRKSIYGENHPDVATSYNNMGLVLSAQGKSDQALACFYKALEIRIAACGENHPDVSIIYTSIADLLRVQKKYEQALEYYEKALKIQKEVFEENSSYASVSHMGIGCVLHELGKNEDAVEHLSKAVEIQKTLYGETHTILASSYIIIGGVLLELNRYEQALDSYEKSLRIGKAVFGEKHFVVADSYAGIGKTFTKLEKYEQALGYYEKALKIRKVVSGENHSSVAVLYNNIGNVLAEQKKHEQALKYYEKSLEILKMVYGESHSDVAVLYNDIGVIFQQQGDYVSALNYFQKSLEIRKIIYRDVHPDLIESYNNIALACSKKGDKNSAFFYYTLALNMSVSLYGQEHPVVAKIYSNLGSLFHSQGKCNQALEYQNKALEIIKSLYEENYPEIRSIYNNIGVAFMTLGRYTEALECYQKVLETSKLLHDDKEDAIDAAVYTNIGRILFYQESFERSLDAYHNAKKILETIYGDYHPDLMKLHFNYALTYLALGDIKSATESFYKCIDFCKETEAFLDTIAVIKGILSIGLSFGTFDIEDLNFIENVLRTGINVAERARLDMFSMKTDVMQQSLPLYYYGVRFESARGNWAKAFEYSESLRNRGFLDQLGIETAINLDGVTQDEKERIQSLLDEISAARNEMEQQTDLDSEYNDASYRNAGHRQVKAEKELAALDDAIGKRLPAYAQLRNPQPVDAKAAKKWCGTERTVLEYLLPNKDSPSGLKTSTYCLVITGSDIHTVPLDSEYDYEAAISELKNAVVEKRQSLYAGKTASIHKYRTALYEKLIKPILRHIPKGVNKLVIVPDGCLSALPFDILGNDEDGLLGERYAISFSPSVSVSVLKETAGRTGFSMLGIGNPAYSGPAPGNGKRGSIQLQNANADDYASVAEYYRKNLSEWSVLKGSGEELRNIKTLIFPGEKVDIYEQEKATEQVIKALSRSGKLAEYKQILMACHGYFNAAKPELSVLVFSEASDKTGKTEEDGYLTAGEMALLHMNAEFLNLSACQTGLAAVRNGDGMLGLTRSCIIAGAENVGVTLWEVNDEATRVFQEHLYGFIKEGLPYPDAYRKAKMAMVKSDDWAEPVYWAAFVLYE